MNEVLTFLFLFFYFYLQYLQKTKSVCAFFFDHVSQGLGGGAVDTELNFPFYLFSYSSIKLIAHYSNSHKSRQYAAVKIMQETPKGKQ